MGRFARSVWKTERLWAVGGFVFDCLWGASLARFGKPSDYGFGKLCDYGLRELAQVGFEEFQGAFPS